MSHGEKPDSIQMESGHKEPSRGDDVRSYATDLRERYPNDQFRQRLPGLLLKGIKVHDLEIISVIASDAYGSAKNEDDANGKDKGEERRRQAQRLLMEALEASRDPEDETPPASLGETIAAIATIKGAHLGDREMSELQRGIEKSKDVYELSNVIDTSLQLFTDILGKNAHRGRTEKETYDDPKLTGNEKQKMTILGIIDSLLRAKKIITQFLSENRYRVDLQTRILVQELGISEFAKNFPKKEEGVSVEPTVEHKEMGPEQIIEEAVRVGGFQVHTRFAGGAFEGTRGSGFQTIGKRLPSKDTSMDRVRSVELNILATRNRKEDELRDFLYNEKLREIIDIRPVQFLSDDRRTPLDSTSVRFEDSITEADPKYGREQAMQFVYTMRYGSDWKHNGRGGQAMDLVLVLPKPVAQRLSSAIEKDPRIMRQLLEQHMKQNVLMNPDDWEKITSLEKDIDPSIREASLMKPPWDMWDRNEEIRGVYVRKEGSPPGFNPDDIIPIRRAV